MDFPEPVEAFLRTEADQLRRLDGQLRVAAAPVDVAWTIAEFAGRVLMLEDCVVYLTDADGAHLTQYAAFGPKQRTQRIFENRIRLPFGRGIVGATAQLGAPQLVADTRLDRRYVVDDAPRLSELAVPMLHGEAVLGVIDSEATPADAFCSGHVHALLAIAGRAAVRLAS